MSHHDIRWKQRFSNFKKAVAKLGEVTDRDVNELSELEKEGLIQRFEYTYELAWKTLQDFLRMKGYIDIAGPNPVLKQAFQDGYITDSEVWRKMKGSRELSSHTYDQSTADEIAERIVHSYYACLKELMIGFNLKSPRNLCNMSYGLNPAEINSIVDVFQQNPKVERAVLFGSRAKGNYRTGSDIDIAIEGRLITFDDFLSLKVQLDEFDLLQKIELVQLNKITTPELIDHIERVGVLLFAR